MISLFSISVIDSSSLSLILSLLPGLYIAVFGFYLRSLVVHLRAWFTMSVFVPSFLIFWHYPWFYFTVLESLSRFIFCLCPWYLVAVLVSVSLLMTISLGSWFSVTILDSVSQPEIFLIIFYSVTQQLILYCCHQFSVCTECLSVSGCVPQLLIFCFCPWFSVIVLHYMSAYLIPYLWCWFSKSSIHCLFSWFLLLSLIIYHCP